MNAWSAACAVLAEGKTDVKPEDVYRAILWTAVVILAFVVAGIAIYVVRSRALKADTTRGDVPLSLHNLRQMRHRGEIDDAEMERLKTIVLAQAKKPPPKPPSEGTPAT